MQTANSKQQTANSKQQTANSKQQTADSTRRRCISASTTQCSSDARRCTKLSQIETWYSSRFMHANRRCGLSHCRSDASVTACALQRRTPPAAPSTVRNSASPASVCTASRTRHRTEICPGHHAPRLLAGDAPRSRPRRMPPLPGGRHVEAWRAAAHLDLS
ncbi:hypothetical protein D0A38_16785 [Xanthomonas campestris pv. incanae]|nr:hypothetical protein D0A38_16785 [Xanthomonas campestris pv. incanae]